MLGKHLHEIRELPAFDVEQWRAFLKVRRVIEEHESKRGG